MSPVSASAVTATGAALDDVAIPSIDVATEHLARAVNELALALQTDVGLAEASGMERQQYAKYLTITKIKLENAITVVRSGNTYGRGDSGEVER